MKESHGVFLTNGVSVFAVCDKLYNANPQHYKGYRKANDAQIAKFLSKQGKELVADEEPRISFNYVHNFIHDLEGSKEFEEQDLRDYAVEIRGLSKTKAKKWTPEELIDFIKEEETGFLRIEE